MTPPRILSPHMAGLTQANKICADVGGVRAGEVSEGLDVVDGQALANMSAAFFAMPFLLFNYDKPSGKPSASAISFRPANPIGRIRPARFCCVTAIGGAKLSDSILLRHPRLLPETGAAPLTGQGMAFLPVRVGTASNILGSEGIYRSFTRAELVPNQVGLGGSIKKSFCLPARPARQTAKTRPCCPVRLYKKGRIADFTGFFDHSVSIPRRRYIGNGTTLIACRRVEAAYAQPDLFIAPPTPKAIQEQLL